MTPRLPTLTPKKVLRVLQRAGFFIHHSTGSHRILKHPEKPTLRITVPFHNKDLKPAFLTPNLLRRRRCRVYGVALGRPPQRTIQYVCGSLGRTPCIHSHLQLLATIECEKYGFNVGPWSPSLNNPP